MTHSAPSSANSRAVGRLILVGLLTRVWVDTGVQLFFPFLPLIAQGLGTSGVTLGRLLSLRSLMGLLAPLFGALGDRRGYRAVMRLGLLLSALGYALIGASPNLWVAALGLLLSGMGTFAFAPSLQAYLSARLAYARRARGLGVVEYAWALSGIVGLSLMGQLIALASWRVPLFILSGGLFFIALLYGRLPAARPLAPTEDPPWAVASPTPGGLDRLRRFFDLGPNRRSAWGVLASGSLIMFSGFHLFISYGSWLLNEYGLGPAQLGAVALILGGADLGGSVTVSLITDRLGKRRSVLWGAGATGVGLFVLPWLNRGIALAMVGLVLVRFAFEFTVVSNLPLLSEQVPHQRGKVLTLASALALLGPTLAGFSGPWSYAAYGVWGLSWIPAGAMGVVLWVIWTQVKEPP